MIKELIDKDTKINELQNKIDSAIEKLNNMLATYYESNMAQDMQNIFDLLEILGGE